MNPDHAEPSIDADPADRTPPRFMHLPLAAALVVAAICLGGGLVGCETTKGVGQDIENLGESIDDAVDD